MQSLSDQCPKCNEMAVGRHVATLAWQGGGGGGAVGRLWPTWCLLGRGTHTSLADGGRQHGNHGGWYGTGQRGGRAQARGHEEGYERREARAGRTFIRQHGEGGVNKHRERDQSVMAHGPHETEVLDVCVWDGVRACVGFMLL